MYSVFMMRLCFYCMPILGRSFITFQVVYDLKTLPTRDDIVRHVVPRSVQETA